MWGTLGMMDGSVHHVGDNWLCPVRTWLTTGDSLIEFVINYEYFKIFHSCSNLLFSFDFRYNPKKGFYCQVVRGHHTQCLGRSKGRNYPNMEVRAEHFLKNYFRKYNVALSKMLSRLGQSVPDWLEEELREQWWGEVDNAPVIVLPWGDRAWGGDF